MSGARFSRAGGGDATASLGSPSATGFALVVTTGSAVIAVPLPDKECVTLGRGKDCDIVIPDASVSRIHATITRSPCSIEDNGSRHGTVVMGHRLEQGDRAPLPLGAVIEVGQATLVLVRATAAPLPPAGPTEDFVVADAVMRALHQRLGVIARSPLPVLIQGETGTGKELFARAVHALSPRHAKAFVALNCAAMPESLLESELFGHERGAFTGATHGKPGLFEAADGGTLFLDEVGDLAPATQSKLLRVLENGEVTRVGSVKSKLVDTRIVAATNRDLSALVAEEQFRADLFYRLNGFVTTLPPLRDRPDDLLPLSSLFARRMAERLERGAPEFEPQALEALKGYAWPGNVRELRHVVERAVALCSVGGTIAAEHLMLPGWGGAASAPTVPPRVGAAASRSDDKERILGALRAAFGNQTEAAKQLGMSRQTLLKKLDLLGVGRPRKGHKG